MEGIVFYDALCFYNPSLRIIIPRFIYLLASFSSSLCSVSLRKKWGKESRFALNNYHRSDVTIFVVCRLLISAPLLLVCWLAHRQISAAPVLSPRSCRVGSHIRLTFSLACPYMTTVPCG